MLQKGLFQRPENFSLCISCSMVGNASRYSQQKVQFAKNLVLIENE